MKVSILEGGWRRLLIGLVVGGFALAGLSQAAASQAANLFVTAAGSDSNPCTLARPCLTIGHAVSIAGPYSTINVGPGTYAEMVTITSRLRLLGNQAIIDATGLDNGILVDTAGAAGTDVRGFDVKNATFEGILVRNTSRVTIQNNTVEHNDLGAFSQNPTGECAPQGPIPGDCGEALHLWSVAHARIIGNVVRDNVGGILLTDESGPTHDNLVRRNTVVDNAEDCGITLPSHNGQAMTNASLGGVYRNTIIDNDSERNGGAGIGMFAPFPGTASYNNLVANNITKDNGEGGINIHSHAPNQNVSGNAIVNNTISGNGVDPDSGSTHPNGISLLAVEPQSLTIAANSFSDEYYGIFVNGPFTIVGLQGNHFDASVTVQVQQ